MILLHNQNKIKTLNTFLLYFNYFLFFLMILGIIRILWITTKSSQIKLIDIDFETMATEQKASLFGSVNSTNYYSIGCKKGNAVSDNNKIWFSGAVEARKAGYEPSRYCDFSTLIDF